MADKYMEAIDAGSAFLEHHGILGMHWGIRRTPAQLGYKKAQKTKAKQEKAAARKEKIMRDPKLLAKHAKEFTDAELVQAYNRFRAQEAIGQMANKPKKEKARKQEDPAKAARKLERQKARAERKKIRLQSKLDEKSKEKEAERKEKNQPKKTFEQRMASAANIAQSASKLLTNANVLGKQGRTLTDEMGLTKHDKDAPSWFSGIFSKQNFGKMPSDSKDGGKEKTETPKAKEPSKASNSSGGQASSVNVTVNNNIGDVLKGLGVDTNKDPWLDPNNWSKETSVTGDRAWRNKNGDLDMRVYGKHTKKGKKYRKEYAESIAMNGEGILDAIIGATDSSPSGGRKFTNDDVPWGAIMENLKV